MKRLTTLALLAVTGGGGWMFLKGLHLDDIQQIFVTASNHASSSSDFGGAFVQPSQPASHGAATSLPPAWRPPAGATIKIATFNIKDFGDAKAEKPYVIDTLAQIVSRFDVVAIQEISTQDAYFIPKFLTRVNQLTDRRYDSRVGPRLGNTTSKEQYAFIFDVAKVQVHPHHVYTIRDPDNLLHREPHVAMFATRGVPIDQAFTFILINTHTDPDVAGEEMDALAQVYTVVRRQSGGEDDVILLGDLNTNVAVTPSNSFGSGGRSLQRSDLFGVGQIPGIYPVVQHEPTNTVRSKLHDNILLHAPSTTEYTGRGGVYDIARLHGLSASQVEEISDHLPVWAEFSITENVQPGRMASEAGDVRR